MLLLSVVSKAPRKDACAEPDDRLTHSYKPVAIRLCLRRPLYLKMGAAREDFQDRGTCPELTAILIDTIRQGANTWGGAGKSGES